jgi:hypothetical protein
MAARKYKFEVEETEAKGEPVFSWFRKSSIISKRKVLNGPETP